MWRVFQRYLAFRRFISVLVENALIIFCVLDAVLIRTGEAPGKYVWRAFAIAIIFQLFLHLRDVYEFQSVRSQVEFLARLGQALLLASSTLFALYYLVPDLVIGRGVFAIAVGLVSAFLFLWHLLLRLYFGVRAPRTNIVIIGIGTLARELAREILRRPELGIAVVGFVDDDASMVGVSIVNPKMIGLTADLTSIVAERGVDQVVVALQDRRGQLPINDLLQLKTRGIAIEEATSLYERVTGKIAVENLKPSWMIFNDGFHVSRSMMIQKQILSFAVSFVLLLLFAPIFPLLALLIKLDSRGPIFHRQERVGKDGRIFTLWKLRSMKQDAERETGPVWASTADKRVTRVGKYLRRLRFDEVPQLYNVLLGHMSLVGPRPERPHFVKELSAVMPFYHLRHSVKPGITGWAQVNYRYGNTVDDAIEKLQYDLFYVKHMSWLLDFVIVFQTAKTLLVRPGS
jgi:sugar transferase (PEP-CTERM system associated)